MTAPPLAAALKAQDEAAIRRHGPAKAVLMSPTEWTVSRSAALVLAGLGPVETELLLRVWIAMRSPNRVEVAS